MTMGWFLGWHEVEPPTRLRILLFVIYPCSLLDSSLLPHVPESLLRPEHWGLSSVFIWQRRPHFEHDLKVMDTPVVSTLA